MLVVGDVNSTIACALVASKLGVPIAHVEAGLRSFDRTMPRRSTGIDGSDLGFAIHHRGVSCENLGREGIDRAKVHFVGNVMIDTLLAHRERARATRVHASLGVEPGTYGLMTLHRPATSTTPLRSNGSCRACTRWPRGARRLSRSSRTRPAVTRSPTAAAMVEQGRLRLVDPLGYLDFVGLMEGARVVLTDSGGIQEETTILGVPCLTLRENTERPITITHGTNQLVGTTLLVSRPDGAAPGSDSGRGRTTLVGGKAAERIAEALQRFWD